MQLYQYARQILCCEELEIKLAPPDKELSDTEFGEAIRPILPARCPSLRPKRGKRAKVPPAMGMRDPLQRARILHALANHELQAVELFAWGIVAFPGTPPAYRRGLLSVLKEEQDHCRLYIDRVEALGHKFGDFPVSSHLWNQIVDIYTPSQFICAVGLTFENANLDFAKEYHDAAVECGDLETAAVLKKVHEDEIRHVAFSWRWHKRFHPDQCLWSKYAESLPPKLSPGRARGRGFDRAARIAAGISSDFIDKLEHEQSLRPNGSPR